MLRLPHIFAVSFLLFLPSTCHQAEQAKSVAVEPGEKAATVAVQDFTKCGGCGGWVIDVDNMTFRSELPAEFTKPNTPVWLRYEKDESSDLKKAGGWIKILSIRNR